jgi:HSP20 family molecular chaperone IbpA
MNKNQILKLTKEFEELFENYIKLPLKLQGKEDPYYNIIESDEGYELVYNNIDIYFHEYDFNIYIDNLSEKNFKDLTLKFKNIKSLNYKFYKGKNTKLYEIQLSGIPYICKEEVKEILIYV